MKQNWKTGILILACLVTGGCRSESERMANLADRTIELQSKQNTTIVTMRKEMVELNRDIQLERKELSNGFKQLESDRRDLHQLRRSEVAWAESFQFLAIVIAAAMPLLVCAYLIWAATKGTNDAEVVNEILIQELVAKQPRLIAGPNRPAIKLNSCVKAIDSKQTDSEQSENSNTQQEENN